MAKILNISLTLGVNERFDHRILLGIIKYARSKENWRLFGNEWLFQAQKGHRVPKPDGIIARIKNREDLKRLKAYQVPVVDIAGSYDDERLYRAVNNDRLTGFMAGKHLADCGLGNFAFVGLVDSLWSMDRMHGLQDATREAQADEVPFFSADSSWLTKDVDVAPLSRWLRKLSLPCGILAANDVFGYKVSVAAAMVGLRIPEQLVLIGVDNEELFCELSQPPLSSVSCDCEKIGWEAADLLNSVLREEDPLRQVIVPPQGIVPRESTNIVIGEDELVRDIKRYIRANAINGINVNDVAAAFPLSRRALEKRFQKYGGTTIHEEILTTRLEKSRRLLETGKNGLEAGLGSGFSSVQHFYYTFKKHVGMTPIEYAEKARAEKGL